MNKEKLVSWRKAIRDQRIEQVKRWIASTTDARLKSELDELVRRLEKKPRSEVALEKCKKTGNAAKVRRRKEVKGGHNHRKAWTDEQEGIVASSPLPDAEIAKQLGRSYQAVQRRRELLKKAAP